MFSRKLSLLVCILCWNIEMVTTVKQRELQPIIAGASPIPSTVPITFTQTRPTLTCLVNEYGPNCVYCLPQDTCENGHYTCNTITGEKLCLPGWKGSACTEKHVSLDSYYNLTCPENNCRNGGLCISGTCCCQPGYTGVLCQIEIIECQSQPCQNGGICRDLVGGYECSCPSGYKGKSCEVQYALTPPTITKGPRCDQNVCYNGGTCYQDSYFTYCLCPLWYTGRQCETLLNRTGISKNTTCPDDMFGDSCSIRCVPQNSCFGGHYICDPADGGKVCLVGWMGVNCDTRRIPQELDNSCPLNVTCKNDGQCFEDRCCCKNHYTGKFCNEESIGCLSNPCQNGGVCIAGGTFPTDYNCNCIHGFEGEYCEFRITTAAYTRTDVTSSSIFHTSVKPSDGYSPTTTQDKRNITTLSSPASTQLTFLSTSLSTADKSPLSEIETTATSINVSPSAVHSSTSTTTTGDFLTTSPYSVKQNTTHIYSSFSPGQVPLSSEGTHLHTNNSQQYTTKATSTLYNTDTIKVTASHTNAYVFNTHRNETLETTAPSISPLFSSNLRALPSSLQNTHVSSSFLQTQTNTTEETNTLINLQTSNHELSQTTANIFEEHNNETAITLIPSKIIVTTASYSQSAVPVSQNTEVYTTSTHTHTNEETSALSNTQITEQGIAITTAYNFSTHKNKTTTPSVMTTEGVLSTVLHKSTGNITVSTMGSKQNASIPAEVIHTNKLTELSTYTKPFQDTITASQTAITHSPTSFENATEFVVATLKHNISTVSYYSTTNNRSVGSHPSNLSSTSETIMTTLSGPVINASSPTKAVLTHSTNSHRNTDATTQVEKSTTAALHEYSTVSGNQVSTGLASIISNATIPTTYYDKNLTNNNDTFPTTGYSPRTEMYQSTADSFSRSEVSNENTPGEVTPVPQLNTSFVSSRIISDSSTNLSEQTTTVFQNRTTSSTSTIPHKVLQNHTISTAVNVTDRYTYSASSNKISTFSDKISTLRAHRITTIATGVSVNTDSNILKFTHSEHSETTDLSRNSNSKPMTASHASTTEKVTVLPLRQTHSSGSPINLSTENNTAITSSKVGNPISTWWLIIVGIIIGVILLAATAITIVVLLKTMRSSESRTLKRSPEEILAFDKEHFSSEPDFENPVYDINEPDFHDDSVKSDIYVVNR